MCNSPSQSFTSILRGHAADIVAGERALQLRLPAHIVAPFLWYTKLIGRIQKRLVTILMQMDKKKEPMGKPGVVPSARHAQLVQQLKIAGKHSVDLRNAWFASAAAAGITKRTELCLCFT